MISLDVIPPFEIILCFFIVVLFLITGFLNLQDLKKMKQDNWTRQDSVALMLRMIFYAFLLNLLVTVLITAGLLLTALKYPASLQRILSSTLAPLETSFIVLLVTGVTFGLAKWKDWYDLVDEEY